MPVSIKEDKYRRSLKQLKETYELEKKLGSQLKKATKEERKHLYISLYDEYFKKLPQHPMLLRKANPKAIAWVTAQRMQLLSHFLKPDTTFLEVGPGDCSLSIAIAQQVKKVYAVDVSNEIAKNSNFPSNFELIISDGCSVPVPSNSVDVAYSHQLMEHLHPEDANEQIQNIYQALASGGIYICITPNRLSGPHDTSAYFENVATGWHLKEYTVSELYQIFRSAGFSRVDYYKSRGSFHRALPLTPLTNPIVKGIEQSLDLLPFSWRRKLATLLTFRGITIVGTK